ncbi:predicted protein [Naegleria gruberi]|uniref:Predicted protein n=1 Tax=Naegleria gruberi TaxID=5762 RepID=D2VVE9_NAEGR|nr:uncharacterized protein NAEGRDRAFT_72992 [Naegleria gruberi]EFC39223.1 predicted protein [Naegleria gruberi]|eukprot:XP_002671967.1 predicted protein [Naegleria gruberi strain NEG-M]
MKLNLLVEIPSEVFEFVVCKFLDTKTLFSLMKINKRMRDILLSSSIIWENTLRSMINNQEETFTVSEKEMNIGRVLKKLLDEFLDQIKEFKNNGLIKGILHYLNENEFKTLYEEHCENAYFFLYCLFRAFSFDKSGFPKRIPLKSREDEVHYSLVDFTNNDHCFHSCHTILNGDWETCRARKNLLKHFRYYWAIHLTNYHEEVSNAWITLVGVDGFENQPRNQDSYSLHYYLGCGKSRGRGYCVNTHSKHSDGTCAYTISNINSEGDVIGVEYFQQERTISMKFYSQFGNVIVSYEYDLKESEDISDFRPAVSIVSRISASIIPWDGSIETLQKLKQ